MSRLLENSEEFRKNQVAKNTYDKEDEFGISHPNALSDGDDKGKGESDGTIGSKTDIENRRQMLTKNRFSYNKPYDDSTA